MATAELTGAERELYQPVRHVIVRGYIAQPLLVLERAHRRHVFEVEVERRRAHPHVPREGLDPERVTC